MFALSFLCSLILPAAASPAEPRTSLWGFLTQADTEPTPPPADDPASRAFAIPTDDSGDTDMPHLSRAVTGAGFGGFPDTTDSGTTDSGDIEEPPPTPTPPPVIPPSPPDTLGGSGAIDRPGDYGGSGWSCDSTGSSTTAVWGALLLLPLIRRRP